jgi:hypothetical protein
MWRKSRRLIENDMREIGTPLQWMLEIETPPSMGHAPVAKSFRGPCRPPFPKVVAMIYLYQPLKRSFALLEAQLCVLQSAWLACRCK